VIDKLDDKRLGKEYVSVEDRCDKINELVDAVNKVPQDHTASFLRLHERIDELEREIEKTSTDTNNDIVRLGGVYARELKNIHCKFSHLLPKCPECGQEMP